MFKVEPLSRTAVRVLGQLYAYGPTWDGNIISKAGRNELCLAGLAFHAHGYASLTPEGVHVASKWDINELHRMNEHRWVDKRRAS